MALQFAGMPPQEQPCEFLPTLQWELDKLVREIDAMGGFRPEIIAEWQAFFATCGQHVTTCPVCDKTIDEFVAYIHTHPLPTAPKHQNIIVEWVRHALIGTAFMLFAPSLYQKGKRWLTGDDEHH